MGKLYLKDDILPVSKTAVRMSCFVILNLCQPRTMNDTICSVWEEKESFRVPVQCVCAQLEIEHTNKFYELSVRLFNSRSMQFIVLQQEYGIYQFY